MPEISIIIPVYNVEKYISKCLDSVLGQTFDNIEIIAVDDGSTDKSGKICESYAQKDSRLRIIHKQNGGLSSARNAGIEAACGRFIMTVDADDFVEPTLCEELYRAITKTDSDMAVCGIKNITDDETPIPEYDNDSPLSDCVLTPADYRRALLCKGSWYYVVAWNKLYKREILSDVRYPVGKIHEDEYIIHRIINNCKKIVCIPSRLYNYVKHSGSITNSAYSVKRLEVLSALFDRTWFYMSSDVEDEAIAGNTVATIKVLYESYTKADLKNSAFKEAYKQIHKELKKLAVSVLKYKMSFVYRVFIAANAISPRLAYIICGRLL